MSRPSSRRVRSAWRLERRAKERGGGTHRKENRFLPPGGVLPNPIADPIARPRSPFPDLEMRWARRITFREHRGCPSSTVGFAAAGEGSRARVAQNAAFSFSTAWNGTSSSARRSSRARCLTDSRTTSRKLADSISSHGPGRRELWPEPCVRRSAVHARSDRHRRSTELARMPRLRALPALAGSRQR
jgi:hypothetical protein